MDTHLFGDNPDAATDRKNLQDAFRAKHRDVLQDDE
jgi:hypothetical protein